MKRLGLESIILLMKVYVATAETIAAGNHPVVIWTRANTPKTANIPKFLSPRICLVDSVTIAEVVTGRFTFWRLAICQKVKICTSMEAPMATVPPSM